MNVTLSLPDALYETYKEHFPQNPHAALINQLKRFAPYSPHERVLLFTKEDRLKLERLYGDTVEPETVDKFVAWIAHLKSVAIGDIQVPISDGQLKRVEGEAKFFESDPKTLLEVKVKAGVANALGGI